MVVGLSYSKLRKSVGGYTYMVPGFCVVRDPSPNRGVIDKHELLHKSLNDARIGADNDYCTRKVFEADPIGSLEKYCGIKAPPDADATLSFRERLAEDTGMEEDKCWVIKANDTMLGTITDDIYARNGSVVTHKKDIDELLCFNFTSGLGRMPAGAYGFTMDEVRSTKKALDRLARKHESDMKSLVREFASYASLEELLTAKV